MIWGDAVGVHFYRTPIAPFRGTETLQLSEVKMRIIIALCIAAAATATVGSHARAADPQAAAQVSGRVLILKDIAKEPTSPVNWGGLIIVEIHDSGSRPPRDIKVDAGKCLPLGHVRGVATNRDGRPMMGGGYMWYLFKAPAEGDSVAIEASYVPNGEPNAKPVKREYRVRLDKNG
jgi:hypothetical protein